MIDHDYILIDHDEREGNDTLDLTYRKINHDYRNMCLLAPLVEIYSVWFRGCPDDIRLNTQLEF